MSEATIVFRDPTVDHVYVVSSDDRLTIRDSFIEVRHEDGQGTTLIPIDTIKTITVRHA